MTKCENCGAEMPDTTSFCGECGCPVAQKPSKFETQTQKSGAEVPKNQGKQSMPEGAKAVSEAKVQEQKKNLSELPKGIEGTKEAKSKGTIWKVLTVLFALAFFALLAYHLNETNRLLWDRWELRQDYNALIEKVEELEKQVSKETGEKAVVEDDEPAVAEEEPK